MESNEFTTAARLLGRRQISLLTPEQHKARSSRGGKSSWRDKTDPQGRLLLAYSRYVKAWKLAQRELQRKPYLSALKVPDPATVAPSIAQLLEQQAKKQP